jgi:hypothetical protein
MKINLKDSIYKNIFEKTVEKYVKGKKVPLYKHRDIKIFETVYDTYDNDYKKVTNIIYSGKIIHIEVGDIICSEKTFQDRFIRL